MDRKSLALFGMAVIAIAGMVAVSACTSTVTPTATPTPAPSASPSATPTANPNEMASFNRSDNNTTANIKGGDTFMITLEENPSTGYAWNATVTSGLSIVNTTYLPPNTTLVGASGLHQWTITTTNTGDQQFSAIYARPNQTAMGNETTYVLNVIVTPPVLGMLWP